MHANPGYYQALCDLEMNYPNPDFQQVEIDVKRTFPHVKDL